MPRDNAYRLPLWARTDHDVLIAFETSEPDHPEREAFRSELLRRGLLRGKEQDV